MRRKLITGKYITQRCECNSEWILSDILPRTQKNLAGAVDNNYQCRKCGYFPWAEGEKDIQLVIEAIASKE